MNKRETTHVEECQRLDSLDREGRRLREILTIVEVLES